jgi:iron complex outermembrane receptor protein
MQLFSVFIQDEIALVPDKVYLTVGSKLEHNYYTGFNAMPSARLAWIASPRQMFWAAVSQADRTPAETDAASRINFAGFQGPTGPPTLFALVGNPHLKNEGMIAYEAGYRNTLLSSLSIDVAAFYNDYDHQETTEPAAAFFENSPGPPHLVLPVTFQNLSHGEEHGIQVSANWKIADRWTLSPGYSFEQIHMHLDPTSHDADTVEGTDGSTPAHSAQLRSHVNLGRGMGWDVSGYFVDRLKTGIPSYTRLDTGLTWRWTEALAVSVVGQNLVKDRHLEFVDDIGSVRSTLIKRSVYAKFTWQF